MPGKFSRVASAVSLLLFVFLLPVSAHSISDGDVRIEFNTAVYTGIEICPKITVKALSEKKDYFVTYANNINAGRAVVMVDDVNDECETLYKYFDILPCDIKNTKIKLSYTNATYSGKKKKPAVTVTYNGKSLENGADYKVSYKNNTKVGKATVTVKGIGNFHGEASKSFYIKPNKVRNVSVKKITAKTVKLSWSKAEGATEYRIYVYKNGKWKYIGNSKNNSFTVKNLKSDTKYKFRVRAVTELNNKTLYGAYSNNITVRTKLAGSDNVYVSAKGKKYHRKNCSYLKKSKTKITYSQARKNNYTKCSRCFS